MNEINFCNKKCYEVINFNNEIKKNLNNFNIFKKTNKIIVNEIPNSEHLTTLKVGKKFFLFLTKINNKMFSFLIDYKTKKILLCRFRFNEDLYNNTLIIGEISKNKKNQWVFYISDLILYKNKNQIKIKFSDRLEIIYKILKENYIYDEFMNVCNLEIKPYFLIDNINNIKINTNIYFIPEDTFLNPIKKMKFEKKNIEKKINNEKTLLLIKKTEFPDVYKCFKNNKSYGILFIKNIKESNDLNILFSTNQEIELNCIFNLQFNKWTLL